MELHNEVVSAQPWAFCFKPPLTTESNAEFHRRRRLESQATRAEMRECVSMGGEDALLGRVKPTPRPHRHFVNVHPTPSHTTKYDANSELQKSDPEHYGPYLEEGEKYNKPRSHENVEAACEAMGLNALADEDKDERPFLPAAHL